MADETQTESFGAWLERIRIEKGLGLRAFARLTRGALSAPYILALESGRIACPGVSKLRLVAKYYVVPYSEVLERSGYAYAHERKRTGRVKLPHLRQLKPRQEMFCRLLSQSRDFNATTCYTKAGFEPKDRRSATVGASILIRKPHVQARIRELMQEKLEEVTISKNDVLAELKLLLQSDVDNYYFDHKDQRIKLRDGAPKLATRAISSFQSKSTTFTDENGNTTVTSDVKFRLYDKVKAIHMSMQYLRMLMDKAGIENPDKVLAGYLGIPVEDLPT